MLSKLLLVLLIGLMVFLTYNAIKRNPQSFSKDNLNRSFYLVGWLALGLIGLVALMIILLKKGYIA